MSGAKRFRREYMRTRSTFVPMPPNPTVDVEGVESPQRGSSIATGAVVAVLLVTFGFALFVIALAVFR